MLGQGYRLANPEKAKGASAKTTGQVTDGQIDVQTEARTTSASYRVVVIMLDDRIEYEVTRLVDGVLMEHRSVFDNTKKSQQAPFWTSMAIDFLRVSFHA